MNTSTMIGDRFYDRIGGNFLVCTEFFARFVPVHRALQTLFRGRLDTMAEMILILMTKYDRCICKYWKT